MTRTVVGKQDEMEPGGSRVFSVEGKRVLVIDENGTLKAFKDLCPHAGGSLKFDGTEIVCKRHGAHFDAESGDARTAPALGMTLTAMDVRIEDGAIVLYEEDIASP